jgi:hypothetical protein
VFWGANRETRCAAFLVIRSTWEWPGGRGGCVHFVVVQVNTWL